MTTFIDSNIWIRATTCDHFSSSDCEKLLRFIGERKIKTYTSSLVLLECSFVLRGVYSLDKYSIQAFMQPVLHEACIEIIETTNVHKAFRLHKECNVKFSDCLIATQVPNGIPLVSYDREFDRLPSIKRLEPGEVLERF